MLPREFVLLICLFTGLWTCVLPASKKPALPFLPGYNLADPRSNIPGISPWNMTVTTRRPALYRPSTTTTHSPVVAMLQKGRSMFGWNPQSNYNYQPSVPSYQGYGWGYNNQYQNNYQWPQQGAAAPSFPMTSFGWNAAPQVSSYANGWSGAQQYQSPAVYQQSSASHQNSYWAPTQAPNRWQPATTPPPKTWGYGNNQMIPQAQSWMFPNIPTPPPYSPMLNNMSYNPTFSWRPAAPAPMPWQKKPWPPPAAPQYSLSMPNPNSVDFDRYTFENGMDFQAIRMKQQVEGGGLMPNSILEGYCVYPFNQLDTGCYYFSEETVKDYEQAKQICLDKKAELAMMDTFNTAEVMKLFMRMQMITQANYYIALQQTDEGEWQWVKTNMRVAPTMMTYATWCQGEPKPGNRKCAAVEPTPPSDRMCWRAEPCKHPNKPMNFICEKMLSNGMSQRRAVASQNFWRESFWLPGYVKVLEEYGNIITLD